VASLVTGRRRRSTQSRAASRRQLSKDSGTIGVSRLGSEPQRKRQSNQHKQDEPRSLHQFPSTTLFLKATNAYRGYHRTAGLPQHPNNAPSARRMAAGDDSRELSIGTRRGRVAQLCVSAAATLIHGSPFPAVLCVNRVAPPLVAVGFVMASSIPSLFI
jgi:hypothetical protein